MSDLSGASGSNIRCHKAALVPAAETQPHPTPDQHEGRCTKRARAALVSPEDQAPEIAALEPVVEHPQPIWLKSLANHVVGWLHELSRLHPACLAIPGDDVFRLTVAIFRLHIQRGPPAPGEPARAVAAASLWVAIKFMACRTSLPNASFLGHVTGVPNAVLLASELEVLQHANWDVYAIARAAKVIGPPVEDEP